MKVKSMKFYTRINSQKCIETACILTLRNDKLHLTASGESKCNPKDINNEYAGKKIAVSRAIGKFKVKLARKAAWNYFFKKEA